MYRKSINLEVEIQNLKELSHPGENCRTHSHNSSAQLVTSLRLPRTIDLFQTIRFDAFKGKLSCDRQILVESHWGEWLLEKGNDYHLPF